MTIGDIEVLDAIPGYGGRRAGSGRKTKQFREQVEAINRGKESADLFGDDAAAGATQAQSTTAEYNRAKARKESSLADMSELAFKIKSGEYVEREAVRAASATLLSSLAQSLRSLPDNLERKFNLSPEAALAVSDVIDAALSDVADGLEMFSGDVTSG